MDSQNKISAMFIMGCLSQNAQRPRLSFLLVQWLCQSVIENPTRHLAAWVLPGLCADRPDWKSQMEREMEDTSNNLLASVGNIVGKL